MRKKFNPPHKNSEVIYCLREAEVLTAKKKHRKALLIVQKFNQDSLNLKTKLSINSLKAICFYQLGNKDSAFFYGKRFLKLHKKSPNIKKKLAIIYDIMARLYYENRVIDSAFKYSELTIKELNILTKSKNEANKSHYLYDYKNAKELNQTIINRSSKTTKAFILIGILLFILTTTFIYFLYKKNSKSINLPNKENSQNKLLQAPKKEYNIDEKLEKEILEGIKKLKSSKEFLNPDFNINALAKKLNTNTSYLSYTINNLKNQSFKQYITELRIEYLIEKLTNEKKFRNYTIKSLAEEIGYTNASAFTRAFKKYKGITPSEYIKSLN